MPLAQGLNKLPQLTQLYMHAELNKPPARSTFPNDGITPFWSGGNSDETSKCADCTLVLHSLGRRGHYDTSKMNER